MFSSVDLNKENVYFLDFVDERIKSIFLSQFGCADFLTYETIYLQKMSNVKNMKMLIPISREN